LSLTLEVENLTEDQRSLVEQIAASDGRVDFTLGGQPVFGVETVTIDEFEPLTVEEEEELIKVVDQADEDMRAGRLANYRDIRNALGLIKSA
jgi:hypothetical protein